jgi:hypothetical protein
MPQDGPAAGPPCDSCGEPRGPEQPICGACRAATLELRLGSHEWRRIAATRPGDRPGESALDSAKREQQG